MAVASFEDLCAGFCEIAKAPVPELKEDALGRVAFHVILRGVTVNMVHFPHASPEHVFVVFELGPVGEPDRDGIRELRVLLDANFVLQVHPPVFSRNPSTGHAVLQQVYPLFDATPCSLYGLIEKGIDWAVRWRHEPPARGVCGEGETSSASSSGMLDLA